MSMGILLFNLESGIIKLGLEKNGVIPVFMVLPWESALAVTVCSLFFYASVIASILPEAHKRKTSECYSNIQRSIILVIKSEFEFLVWRLHC